MGRGEGGYLVVGKKSEIVNCVDLYFTSDTVKVTVCRMEEIA